MAGAVANEPMERETEHQQVLTAGGGRVELAGTASMPPPSIPGAAPLPLRSLALRAAARLRFLVRRVRWLALALAVISLGVMAIGISLKVRAIEGPPPIDILSDKLAHYAQHAGRYSVVFLGSSRFYNTIKPAVLDAALRENGCNETSFNFGVPGLFGVERDYVLETILASEKKPRWIFTEDVLATIDFDRRANFLSDRYRYVYQLRFFDNALADITSFLESDKVMLARVAKLLYGYVYEYSGVGKLSRTLLPNTAEPPENLYAPGFVEQAGYFAIDRETNPWFAERRQIFLNRSGEWPVLAAQHAQGTTHPKTAARAAYLAERLNTIHAAGIGAGMLFLPQEEPPATSRAVSAELGSLVPGLVIINYNNIKKYPAFYDEALYFDNYHLIDRGAELVSRQLGSDLCKVMKKAASGDAVH